MSESSVAPSSKARILLRRSISSVVILTVTGFTLWLGDIRVYLGFFSLMALGTLLEYFHLFSDPRFHRFRLQTVFVAALYLLTFFIAFSGGKGPWIDEAASLSIFVLLVLIIGSRLFSPLEGERTLHEIAVTIFGYTYCVVLLSFIPKIFLLPLETSGGYPAAAYYLLHFIVLTKASDTGAYLVGSAIGRQKLVPHISPGKTWQGFWGALIFAILGSYLLWWLLGDRIPLVGPISAGVLGLVVALIAVLGDLCESILKRSLSVKDSGRMMPGIGGILDLVDSLIFTAPVYYLFLRLAS